MCSISFNPAMRSNNFTFKGKLGDKFVNEIVNGKRKVTVEEMINASRNRFVGLDTSKVADIFESMITTISKSTIEKPKGQNLIEEQLTNFKHNGSITKVKSVYDIGAVMPEVVIDAAKKIRLYDKQACDSMLTYLLTGKGQESAIEQSERHNIITKARDEGLTQIPELKKVTETISYSDNFFFLISLMERALKSSKGCLILSTPIREQVKTNMMSLLSPYCSGRYYANPNRVGNELDERLEKIAKFHRKRR